MKKVKYAKPSAGEKAPKTKVIKGSGMKMAMTGKK